MKLREARLRGLLTLKELAAKAGVSDKSLWSIEQGAQTPRVSTIRRLAAALEVEAAEIDEFRAAIEAGGGGV